MLLWEWERDVYPEERMDEGYEEEDLSVSDAA